MRFASLDLVKFGPFTDVTLDFSRPSRALHLVVGSNAIGKSTSLRAVVDLLFGIPTTTRDNHQHDGPSLRIGGRLVAEDGGELVLRRRKGNKNTLTDGSEQPVEEARVRAFLGGLGRESFEAMFGLSHEALVTGGRALLEGKGDVGESLFSAGLGGRGVHDVLSRLESKADGLFRPNGKKQPLNQAIAAFREAKKRAREQSLQTKDWESLQNELREQGARSGSIDARLHGLRVDERRLSRIQNALGPVARREDLEQRLAEYASWVVLPEAAAEERRAAEQVLADAEPAERRLTEEVAELGARLATLVVPEELLARRAEMDALRLDLGAHLKAARDLPIKRGELRALEDDALGRLRALGASVRLDEVEALRLSPVIQGRVRTLGRQYGELEAALSAAEEAHLRVDERMRAARARLDGLGVPARTENLRRATELAREEGALEKRLRELVASCDALRERVANGHASLGRWTGPLEAVGSLAVPALESVERFEQSSTALAHDRKGASERAASLRAELSQLDTQLEELKRGAPVPTEDDLATARRERERTWREVRRAWLGDGDSSVPAARIDGGRLALEHETRVRSADEVADRLRREADRVATFASLLARRGAQTRALEKLDERCAELEVAEREDRRRWCALWLPLGIEPLSPSEMRGWLGRYGKLVDARTRWLDALREVEGCRRQIAAHLSALSGELVASGQSAASEGEGLAAVVLRAKAFVDAQEALAVERGALAESIRELETEALRLKGVAARHTDKAKAWQASWLEVTTALGLASSAVPAEADEMVQHRVGLFEKVDEMSPLRHRIAAMEDRSRDFAARVQELVKCAAADLSGSGVERCAEALIERFDAGGKDRVVRDELTRRRAQAAEELAALGRKRERARAQLARLATQAGCATEADLPEAERRSGAVRELHQERDANEALLRKLSDGAGVEALVTACKDQRGDEVFANARALEAEIEAAERDRKEAEHTVGQLRARLEAMSGGDEAAVAAEQAQQELARIRAHVEDYAGARLASMLLREEIDRYRARHQGPIVQRASELFGELTLATFVKLEIAYDEQDRAFIHGVRADGRSVGIDGLSDGTRDQLFLALRLASIERHLEHNDPVPVIVDDILINFDDARASAALRVLGQLATRTQVLFFTHHRHLADLAEQAVAKETLVRHDLDALAGRPAG